MLKGDQARVPKVLLELKDIDIEMVYGVESPVARWIPYHMTVVLTNLSRNISLPPAMRCCLAAICEQFNNVRTHKTQSGDGWEALFVATLLVRCLTNTFCSLVPLQGSYC
jgi:hypothetical protein